MVPQKINDLQRVQILPPRWQNELLPTLKAAIDGDSIRQWRAFTSLLPNSLALALSEPPAKEIVAITGYNCVKRWLEFELIKANELLGVYSGLNDAQVQFIAEVFLKDFENESLADFKICLATGCSGRYNLGENNDLKRFDPIVWRRWFSQYLAEKYQAIEENLMKEPENLYEVKKIPGQLYTYTPDVANKAIKEIQRIIDSTPRPGSVGMRQIQDLTQKEIAREGKDRPAKLPKPKSGTRADYEMRELHFKWIADNYDKYGRPLAGWIDENTYIMRYFNLSTNKRLLRVRFSNVERQRMPWKGLINKIPKQKFYG